MLKIGSLVTAKYLAECLSKFPNKLRVIDATWYLPNSGMNAHDNYKKNHIPGAVFFDIDECVTVSDYEHQLPSASRFEEYAGSLGIDNDTHVIVYNDHPNFAIFSAPRVWWTFRVFGHKAVSVLDGGLRHWKDENLELASGIESVPRKQFKVTVDPFVNDVKRFEDIVENIKSKEFQLVDARSAGRFHGTDPEPRPDTRPGHVPGAISMPFSVVQDKYTGPNGEEVKFGKLKSPEDIKRTFTDLGIDPNKPLSAMCGTGVSGCNLVFAAHLFGKDDMTLYDGSWLEWFHRSTPDQREESPVE